MCPVESSTGKEEGTLLRGNIRGQYLVVLAPFLLYTELSLHKFLHYTWKCEVSSIKAFCVVLMYVLISWKAFNMYLFIASI